MNGLHSSVRRHSGVDLSSIPVLPHGISLLIQRLSNDALDIASIADVVRCYPSIAGKILSVANSAWVSSSRTVVSLDMACQLLGLRVVRTISIALMVSKHFDPTRCFGFDGLSFWCSALLADEAAQVCGESRRLHHHITEASRTAALLHNIGLLWIASTFPVAADQAFLQKRQSPDRSLCELLSDITGTDYVAVGGEIALAWGLPDSIRLAIEHQKLAGYNGEHAEVVTNCQAAISLAERAQGFPASLKAAPTIPVAIYPSQTSDNQDCYELLLKRQESIFEMARILFDLKNKELRR